MAKVIYTPKDECELFIELGEGTYFDYRGTLYLLVDEQRGLVFDFEKEMSFIWFDEFNDDVPVKSISSDRITVKVD